MALYTTTLLVFAKDPSLYRLALIVFIIPTTYLITVNPPPSIVVSLTHPDNVANVWVVLLPTLNTNTQAPKYTHKHHNYTFPTYTLRHLIAVVEGLQTHTYPSIHIAYNNYSTLSFN